MQLLKEHPDTNASNPLVKNKDYIAGYNQALTNQRQELRQELVKRLKKYKSKIKTSGSIYSPGQSKEEVYFSTKEQTINDAINLLKEI